MATVLIYMPQYENVISYLKYLDGKRLRRQTGNNISGRTH